MTLKSNKIPVGYKDSPLGIIPQEWEVKPLCYFGEIYSGGTPDTEVSEYWNGDIAWCTPSDITKLETKYIDKTEVRITEKGLKESSATLLPPRSIVVCTRATIGNAAICRIEISTNQGFKNIIPNDKINPEWLYYIIVFSQSRLIRLGCGSTFLEVSKKDFSRFKIPHPPLAEQEKIAEILSTWDKAIEKQTQLIQKLELRKKGLMQQLLTGKKRLPSFTGEWKKVKLGEIADIVGGGTPNTDINNYWNGTIPWFTPTEIGTEKYVANSKRYITQEGLNNSSARLLPVGTILFTSRATIGLKAILISEATTNQGFQSFIVNKTNSIEYVYYLLDIINDRIQQKASGSTFSEISSSSIRKISFNIPSLQEQTAIANILSSCDEEIRLAQDKLVAMREQKKGLMQVLLTGKKRVTL